MIKQLLEKNEFEVPDVLVERQTYYMMADTHRRMSMQGMQPEATAKFIAQLRDYYREEAVSVVKTFLLMKRIAAKEDIVVSEEELHNHIEQMAKQRGQTFEAMKASLEKDGLMEQLKGDLVNMKVFDYLESKAEYIPSFLRRHHRKRRRRRRRRRNGPHTHVVRTGCRG
jgi:trigger factor